MSDNQLSIEEQAANDAIRRIWPQRHKDGVAYWLRKAFERRRRILAEWQKRKAVQA